MEEYNGRAEMEEHLLLEHFKEELEDACKYARMAEKTPDDAKNLWLIGRDELSHADHFRTLLRHRDYEFSEECEAKWHRTLQKYGFEK